MIAAVQFRNFKALRSASIKLGPFNLFIGPNGSGKTSVIQALLRLRTLSALPNAGGAGPAEPGNPDGPRIDFEFQNPFAGVQVRLECVSDLLCDTLAVEHPAGETGAAQWAGLRPRLRGIRAYLFDHYAIAAPSRPAEGRELQSNAGNLGAVLAERQGATPAAFAELEAEFCRLFSDFSGIELRTAADGVRLGFRLAGAGETIEAEAVAQGTLYLLAILALAFEPSPPPVVCLEDADRGIHPRLLREVRDALYRLSYPQDFAMNRPPVQVIVTTHSPYLLDLFKEHPEEVVLASKRGNAASFERLSDRQDLAGLLEEANLGDLWYSGILGGVPRE